MSVYIFAGPTIDHDSITSRYDFICLPPVSQGDIYNLCQEKPKAIGIIDGYFHGVPSVWHKEILWAMAEGVHVFGSASMGALRASELHAFGMRGVGRVFRMFLDNELEDDDEVAILHAPAEMNFSPLSEAMVNIRATVERAIELKVVDEKSGHLLVESAKNLYYQDRTWEAVQQAVSEKLNANHAERFEQWLGEGRIDIKKQDAQEMLSSMEGFLSDDPGQNQVQYAFEWTEMWEGLVTAVGSPAQQDDRTEFSEVDQRVLDELRLDPNEYEKVTLHAAIRRASLGDAPIHSWEPDERDVRKRVSDFRQERNLFTQESFVQFLSGIQISQPEFERLIREEMQSENWIDEAGSDLDVHRLAYLRVTGKYGPLSARAQNKANALAELGPNPFTPQSIGILPHQLVEHHFAQHHLSPVTDLDQHIQRLGMGGRESFYRLLSEEYVYCQSK